MAQKTKKFRVAVSGTTVDGREIPAEQIYQMAKDYNPSVYGARVNMEHILSYHPESAFGAYGDVTALEAKPIGDGPLKGRVELLAEIDPTERMLSMTADRKKVYTSIEISPNFKLTGGAYLAGIAMTDTPASLGTDYLKFATQQRAEILKFSAGDGEQGGNSIFTEAIEAEYYSARGADDDAGKNWFNKVMGILGKARHADGEQFSRVHQAVEQVAEGQAELFTRLEELEEKAGKDSQELEKLSGDLRALRGQLKTEDHSEKSRPPVHGGADELADY